MLGDGQAGSSESREVPSIVELSDILVRFRFDQLSAIPSANAPIMISRPELRGCGKIRKRRKGCGVYRRKSHVRRKREGGQRKEQEERGKDLLDIAVDNLDRSVRIRQTTWEAHQSLCSQMELYPDLRSRGLEQHYTAHDHFLGGGVVSV